MTRGSQVRQGSARTRPHPRRCDPSWQRGCGNQERAQYEHSITPSWVAGGASDLSDSSPTQIAHCFPGHAACVAVAAQPVDPAAVIEMLTPGVWTNSSGPGSPTYEPVVWWAISWWIARSRSDALTVL